MNISFDVWGTLIKSNPEFKKQQAKLAKEMYGISEEDFLYKMRCEKEIFNTYVENHGFHIPREFVYQRVFDKHDEDFYEFIAESDNLFLKYLPIPLFEEGSDIHSIIRDNKCIVTSNTVMIYGDKLHNPVYEFYNIPYHNMIFSDEVNVSKPNPLIWLKHNEPIDMHIGDNVVTDGACEKLGIKFKHINDYL
jgi:putative hydrolase of the HAD superfamily